MIDSPADSERAVLVHINFRNSECSEDLDEFKELVNSSNVIPVATITCSRDVPDSRYYIGRGKIEDIQFAIKTNNADIVIFNHSITPGQERNLEREFQCRVTDRVGLILDIFAQRARSYEGKLQVELAQLQHLSTRLVRGWTHLERQKGGIGLRGPGETQLETDRRLIGKRIKTINNRLEKVKRQRQQGRKQRKHSDIPIISFVGYTNAGKSTLFNRLTGADVYAADKLFATLDTTLRQVQLAPGSRAIISDTVGFIRHIPHDLIEAFHASLEEVSEADLLLHVVDVNDPQRDARIQQVNSVIDEIGAAHIPQILVFNKIDLRPGLQARVESLNGTPQAWLSAVTGDGIPGLLQLISRHLEPDRRLHVVHIPTTASKFRAALFSRGEVFEERLDEQGGWVMRINISTPSLQRLCRNYGIDEALIQ